MFNGLKAIIKFHNIFKTKVFVLTSKRELNVKVQIYSKKTVTKI